MCAGEDCGGSCRYKKVALYEGLTLDECKALATEGETLALTGGNQMNGVKTWFESKINWTQIIGSLATLATLFGYVVPPDLIPQVVAGLVGLQAALTFVFRTWFTKTVVEQSVK